MAFVWIAVPATLSAQSWSIDTSVGNTSYNIAPISNASNMGIVGIGFTNEHRFLHTSVGVPFSSNDLTWGVAEWGDRFATHRAALTVGGDASVLLHGQRDPVTNTSGQGLMAEFLPMVSHNFGTAELEVRSGARWYGERLGSTNWTRTLWTSEISARVRPVSRLQLEGNVRHYRGAGGEVYTRPGVSLITLVGRVSFRSFAGGWVHNPGGGGVEWGATIGVPIRRNFWFTSAAQHDSFDPTFLSPPRTTWSAGLSFQFARKQETVLRRAESSEVTRVVVRLPLRESKSAPLIAGDFSGWKPVRMDRYDQEWRFFTNLSPGVYHYAFRTEDGNWFVPADTPNRINDGMGGWQAVLVVR